MSQGYYPAALVSFVLRFDELMRLRPDNAPPQTAVELLSAQPNATDGSQAGDPLILRSNTTAAGEDQVSFVVDKVPKTMSLDEGHIRQAGTFQMSVDFRVLPLDPRVLRACTVEIHVGTINPSDFAEGMVRGRLNAQSGRRSSQLRIVPDDPSNPNVGTLRMVGTIDEIESSHDKSSSLVTLHGRDLRGILLDSKVTSGPVDAGHTTTLLDHLNTNRSIDKVVADIVRQHTMIDRLAVLVNPEEWPNGQIPSPGTLEHVPRHRRGARGRGAHPSTRGQHNPAGAHRAAHGARNGMRGTVESLSYWDVIVQLCTVCGAVPTIHNRSIFIRPVRALYDDARAGQNPCPWSPESHTPFIPDVPRQTKSHELFSIRKLVYGQGIEKLTFKKKFAGQNKPKTIRVVADNPSNGQRGILRRVVVQWPPVTHTRGRANHAQTHGENHEEIVTITSHGLTDPGRMTELARSVWEDIGRNELTGTADCGKNLASFGGDGTDADLLRLRISEPVELLIGSNSARNAAPLISVLNEFAGQPFAAAVRGVMQFIHDENLARVIVASSRGQIAGLLQFFRVSSVKLAWDSSSGFSVNFDFQNYVVPRFNLHPDEDPAPLGRHRGHLHRHTASTHAPAAHTPPAAPAGRGITTF